MSRSANWKAFERKTAAIFGTTRALMKGTGEVKDIGPEDDFPLILDCKLRPASDWRIVPWFRKLEEAALNSSSHPRWPVLCLREPGKKRAYAIVEEVPLTNFITKVTKSFQGSDFYMYEAKSRNITPVVTAWRAMLQNVVRLKKLKRLKFPPDGIPIVRIHNVKHNLRLAVLKPEDLARLFFDGGLLKNEGSHDQS